LDPAETRLLLAPDGITGIMMSTKIMRVFRASATSVMIWTVPTATIRYHAMTAITSTTPWDNPGWTPKVIIFMETVLCLVPPATT
jgi:hypothetical protein